MGSYWRNFKWPDSPACWLFSFFRTLFIFVQINDDDDDDDDGNDDDDDDDDGDDDDDDDDDDTGGDYRRLRCSTSEHVISQSRTPRPT